MGLTLCSECGRESVKSQFQTPETFDLDDDGTASNQWTPPGKLKTQFYSERRSLGNKDGHNGIMINSQGRVLKPEFIALDSPRPRYTRGPSLRQKVIERKLINSAPVTPLGPYHADREANLYMSAVEKNTLKQITETNSLAETMVVKNDEIREELIRQGQVTIQANSDVFNTEQDINETSSRIKGMSLHGKVANMIWRKKRKRRQYPGFEVDGDRDYLPRSMSLPAKFAYRGSPTKTRQQHIKNGVNQLIRTMDTLRDEQLGVAEELEHQEPQLQEISNNIGRVNDEIKRQTTQINELQQM